MVSIEEKNNLLQSVFYFTRFIIFYSDAIVKYSDEKYNEPRIVGGEEVVPHSVPHQVALEIDQTYFCGGEKI